MTTRVLFLGLDAAEATLIDRWSESGELPTFAMLDRSARVVRLDDNPMNTLPEAIWHEIHTGLAGDRLGRYYVPGQIRTGEAVSRPMSADEIDPDQFFWAAASAAGCRVAVVDPVHAVPVPSFNGIQLFEYGTHDRHFAVSSDPPELLREICARYGNHPVESCDDHGASEAGYRELLAKLEAGIAQKERIACDLLGREDWDLFHVTFAESHCVGHQFWHFQDPSHPRHDPNAPDAFQSAIKRVYRRLDRAVGALMNAAGDGATVMVVASHGMGVYVGGYQLLPEFLVRLGLSAGRGAVGSAPRTAIRNVYHWLRGRVPLPGERRPFTGSDFGRRIRNDLGVPVDGLQHSATKAIAVLNNRVGAIRLNLKGRDPNGSVAQGREADALVAMLRDELSQLEDPRSGERVVAATTTAREAFGPHHHADAPDLMVLFRTDLGPIEACRSRRVGLIRRPLFKPEKPRTGDHTAHSRLWLSGPSVRPGQEQASTRDLAPTVLQALGVELPPAITGGAIR